MGTLTIRPNGEGYTCNLSIYGDDAAWKCVDETPSDEDTTFVYSESSTEAGVFSLENHTTETGAISKIKVYNRCKSSSATGCYSREYIYIGGSLYEGTLHTLTTSWADYYTEWATNPKTGVAWTWADIDALQAGTELFSSQGKDSYCTQVYVIIEYAAVAYTQTISEILGMADSVVPKGAFRLTVTESMGMVDSAARQKNMFQTVSEVLGMSDSVGTKAAFKQAVSEVLGMVDSAARSRGVPITISETLGLKDRVETRKHLSKIGDLPDDTITGGA